MLHQMPSGVVRNQCVCNAMLPEFPCRETRALIARSGLIDPDVHVHTSLMCCVNRGGR